MTPPTGTLLGPSHVASFYETFMNTIFTPLIIIALISGAACIVHFKRFIKAHTMLHWPTTDGQIIDTKLWHDRQNAYLNVIYTYSIGIIHEDKQVQYATRRYRAGIQKVVDTMPEFQMVHYNPVDHSDSELKVGLENNRKRSIRYMVVYGIFTLIMLATYLIGFYF